MILPINSNLLSYMAYVQMDRVMVVHDDHTYCCYYVSMYPLNYHRQCYHWHLANRYPNDVLDCNVVDRERVLNIIFQYLILDNMRRDFLNVSIKVFFILVNCIYSKNEEQKCHKGTCFQWYFLFVIQRH